MTSWQDLTLKILVLKRRYICISFIILCYYMLIFNKIKIKHAYLTQVKNSKTLNFYYKKNLNLLPLQK